MSKKRINTTEKGRKTVRKGREILETAGWVCDTTEKTGRFIKNKDLFSELHKYFGFDMIAIKPKRTKLIQFKTNRFPSMKPYILFSIKYKQFEVETWCWFDRKGFKTKVFIGGIKKDGNRL